MFGIVKGLIVALALGLGFSAFSQPTPVITSTVTINDNDSSGSLLADLQTAQRAVDWTNKGVLGGIPARSTICQTLTSSATAAQINSAIAGCTAGQAVLLGAGTYSLSVGLVFKSDVTLRGAGPSLTSLNLADDNGCHGARAGICMGSSDTNWKGGVSNQANWTSGYTRGGTIITLSSVANLKVGYPMMLDQLDDTIDAGAIVVTDSSTTFGAATSPGITGPFSLEGNGGGAQRSGRQQSQIVVVASCDGNSTPGHACSSGTNVTITPGLYMPNWSSGKTPQAWWATDPIFRAGIEDVSLNYTSLSTSDAGVEIFNCVDCYVNRVRSIDSGRAHVQIMYSTRFTVRDSYFFLTQNSVSQSYGFECYSGSDGLVENNIFQAIAAPEMINGNCDGTVVGYNFSINNYYTGSSRYNASANNQHTAGINFTLFEGNYGNSVYGDLFHGTHHFLTYFRNRWTGPQPACWQSGSTYATAVFNTCASNLGPIELQSFSRFFNFIGNVLGTTGTNTVYSGGIWSVGGGNSNGTVTVPSDPNVATTLLRWGNCDSATGFGSCRFVSGEIPSSLTGTQAPYSVAVPGSSTIPSSFYLSSKPSWFKTITYPPIGPDVTSGNISGTGGLANMNPAHACYINTMLGPADGTGAVLTFTPSLCY